MSMPDLPHADHHHHSHSRPSSRPNSRPSSAWRMQTDMYDRFGGTKSQNNSDDEDDNVSMTEKGSRPRLSRHSTAVVPEKLVAPGSTRPGMIGHPSNAGTLIKEDVDSDISDEVLPPRGNISALKASLLLGKAFVGTGVLFLPNAFRNGGILFSCLTLSFVAAVCCVSFMMLVKVRLVIRHSFEDIGGVLFGRYMKLFVEMALFLSQAGFCASYINFSSSNISAIVTTLTKCTFDAIAEKNYALILLVVLVPLVLIRRMNVLTIPSMCGNVFIIFGLLYISGFSIKELAQNGSGPDIALFNKDDFAMFIGTAVFSFEGIGLVIPITEAMERPEDFQRVLMYTLIVVTTIFGTVGALGYMAYGSAVNTIIIMNLPAQDAMTITIQTLYSLAMIFSVPLMLSPASRISENWLLGQRSGGQDFKIKMKKNAIRIVLIVICVMVAYAVGEANLDKFVSFVGSAACMPLCFIFPAMFHYKVCAKTMRDKVMDIILGVFGVLAMIFTMYITIHSWVVAQAPKAHVDKCAGFV